MKDKACHNARNGSEMRRMEARKHRERRCSAAWKRNRSGSACLTFALCSFFCEPRKSVARRVTRRRQRLQNSPRSDRTFQDSTCNCGAAPGNSARHQKCHHCSHYNNRHHIIPDHIVSKCSTRSPLMIKANEEVMVQGSSRWN